MAPKADIDLTTCFPQELQQLEQWVCWLFETRGGSSTKVPYNPATRQKARSDDPRTWASFAYALRALELGSYHGLGFVFTADDPYTGVDLDNALDSDGEVKPWARAILDRLPPGVYIEISPSGLGLHIIICARKPGKRCKAAVQDGAVEIYDRGRFFTMTGRLLGEPVSEIAEAQDAVDAMYGQLFFEPQRQPERQSTVNPVVGSDLEILERTFASRNGARIQTLWNGDTNGYASHSEADLALCSHLWFWSGGDRARVDALFRQSSLMREKWNRSDYREATITKAAAGSSVYEPRAASGTRVSGLAPQQWKAEQPIEPPPVRLDPADRPERDNTHRANAWRIARRYAGELRFVSGLSFIVYDGRRWVPSKTGALRLASRVSRIVCTEAAEISRRAAKTDDEDRRKSLERRAEKLSAWARTSEQGAAIRESLKLAAPLLELSPTELDSRPLLLNVENGTINLREGKIRDHGPADFLTTLAPVKYDSRAKAPLWRAFVQEIMGGSESLVRYLQKAFGYSITGLVREQCLFFAHGRGQNGKSTLLDALRHTLGSGYVTKAAPDLLMATQHERPHPSEIANLRGARIVVSQEVTGGRSFDSQKIKELTGERWLKARLMYGDWFDFETTFKLWLAANHQPRVKDHTLAFWRRVHLIPFTHTIAKPVRDFDLKLAAEKSGILKWLIEGAQLYLEEGLEAPSEVTRAVEDYRLESDSLGQFIAECCVTGEGHEVKASELWAAYSAYTEERELSRIRRGDLKTEMLNRGFQQPARRRDGIHYSGLSMCH